MDCSRTSRVFQVLLIALLGVLLLKNEAAAQSDPVAAEERCSLADKEVDIPAAGSSRTALIVTNQAYSVDVGRLEATHKDGEILCRALVAVGFSVRVVRDVNWEDFNREIQGFKYRISRLSGPTRERASFFYYSGHGAAIAEAGANYLIPVAAEIRRNEDLTVSGINLDDLIKQIQVTAQQHKVLSNFLVVDACRNTAFAARSRSATRGFTPVPEQSGLMIGFSTSPGKTAIDDHYYSTALARELQVPNRDAFVVFREVRRTVLNKTNGHQFPWTHDGLVEEFVFKSDPNAPAQPATSPPPKRDILIEDDKPVLVDCDVCPRLRRIDPPLGATGLKAFAIGMYEVTFEDWQACVADRGCGGSTPPDSGFGRSKHPVINASRADIQGYLDWLSRKSGKNYRLPTEAEWTFAASDGKAIRSLHEADPGPLCLYAHANLAAAGGCIERPARGTMEVGRLKANVMGLYDIGGNVAEWVETCFDGSAPKGTGDACDRIVLGGSWRSSPDDLKLGARRRAPVNFAGRTVGFRIARDAD